MYFNQRSNPLLWVNKSRKFSSLELPGETAIAIKQQPSAPIVLNQGRGGTSLYLWGSNRSSTLGEAGEHLEDDSTSCPLKFIWNNAYQQITTHPPTVTPRPAFSPPNHQKIVQVTGRDSFGFYALLTDNSLYYWGRIPGGVNWPIEPMILPPIPSTEPIKQICALDNLYVLLNNNQIWTYSPPWQPWTLFYNPPNTESNIKALKFSFQNAMFILREDGTVGQWDNVNRSFVDIRNTTIFSDEANRPIIDIAGSAHANLLALDDGTVWGWGNPVNSNGVLGNRPLVPNNQLFQITPLPAQINQLTLTINTEAAFAIDQAGRVWSWGTNYHGILGTTEPLNAVRPIPQQITGLTKPIKQCICTKIPFHASMNTILALSTDQQTLFVWGSNIDGLLGNCIDPPPGELYYATPHIIDLQTYGMKYYEKIASIFSGGANLGAIVGSYAAI
ncbi:MAG: hypothetical protein RLZ12_125 [Bacillota bacterium]